MEVNNNMLEKVNNWKAQVTIIAWHLNYNKDLTNYVGLVFKLVGLIVPFISIVLN